MSTYYHGTDDTDFNPTSDNPEWGYFDLCVSDDRSVCESYGQHVHEISLDSPTLGEEEDIREVVEDIFGEQVTESGFYVFEWVDCREVQEGLMERGFDGVEYTDQHPEDFGKTHDTIRIFTPDVVN